MSYTLKTITAAAAAAAAMAIGVMPANAATFSVSAGNAPNGKVVKILGTTQGASPQITFKDVTTGTTLGCTSGTAPGTTTVGSGLSGAGVGKITGSGTTWTGCTGPLGISLQPKGSGTWLINATSYSNGVSTGTITGAKATVTGSGCSFQVTGSVPITYDNSTQILTVLDTTAGLKIAKVQGCFGAVKNKDKASFKAQYKLVASPAKYNPTAITSP